MEKKASKNILLAFMGVLIVLQFIVTIITCHEPIIVYICTWITLAFTALYGFWLYKKPHGNMLRIAMLLFAAANIISDSIFISMGTTILPVFIVGMLISAAVFYGAGRLNRIEQNRILFPIIAVIFFIRSILLVVGDPSDAFIVKISFFGYPIIFLTLMIAYFVRYKEHKDAGLADTPKKIKEGE